MVFIYTFLNVFMVPPQWTKHQIPNDAFKTLQTPVKNADLVPGGLYIHALYIYILYTVNIFNMIQHDMMYILWTWYPHISTSICYLSLVPIPWPKEFTPRYHQLHRVVARQRNFDRWREQLRPLRWKFYGETLGIWWVHTVMEYVEEPAWYRV